MPAPRAAAKGVFAARAAWDRGGRKGGTMTGWLGIDMGGTASRWVWLGPDGAQVRGTAPGATAMVYDEARRAAFTGALAAIRAALPGRPRAAHLGLTGAGFNRDPALNALAALALGLPPDRVSHWNDVELAHRAVFPGGTGHLVLSGTGAVGIGVTARGRAVVGGRGVVLDDRGSAAWIAVQALQAVYARLDATGGTAGVERLAEALGVADWDATRGRVYGDRGALGLMARQVAAAAAGGCPVAADILSRAGAELAAMAGQLRDRLGPAPLAFVGGALRLDAAIPAALRAAWPDAGFPNPDSALAAALHAKDEAP